MAWHGPSGIELVDKSVNLFFFNVLTVLQGRSGIISESNGSIVGVGGWQQG